MKNEKTALVTGASSGIGKETAKQLLNDGWTVYVAARREDKMQHLGELGAIVLKMDITRDEEIVRVAQRVQERNGVLDLLVNNAGYAIYGPAEEIDIEDARRQFEVNLFGLARLTQLVLPAMRRKQTGRIINVSSMGGKIYTPFGSWYHATKHALEGWSDCLRLELKPFGVDVILIEPGVIKTEFDEVMTGPRSENTTEGPYTKMLERIEQSSKELYAKRFSTPDVVAKTISKAATANKPKTRYVIGSMARPMVFLRWLLSDRLFDRVLMSQI